MSEVTLLSTHGEPLIYWVDYSFKSNFLEVLDVLQVTFNPPAKHRPLYRDRLAKGELITTKIAGHIQDILLITTFTEKLDNSGSTMTIEAKSVLVTPLEGSVDPYLARNYSTDTSIDEAIADAMAPYGFLAVVSSANDYLSILTGRAIDGQGKEVDLAELKVQDIQAVPGESAYNFCAKIFTRMGVLLKVNNEATLLIQRPDFKQQPSYTLTEPIQRIADADILLTAETRSTNDGQFSEVIVVGQSKDKAGKSATNPPIAGVKVEGSARPSNPILPDVQLTEVPRGRHSYQSLRGAAYKPLVVEDRRSRDVERATIMAKAILGSHAVDGWQFTGSVQGVVAKSGRVWTAGTTVKVHAPTLGVDENLFVLEVSRSVGSSGSITQFTLIPLDSLVLEDIK